jgi:glycosyltransferase involved in cell wall biosynthesis
MKMKKVLYIISSTVISSSPVGLRIKQWANYLNVATDVYVMGRMPVQKFNIYKRIFLHVLLKLKVVPDRDVFFIPFYKHKIKKTVQNQSFDMACIQTLPFSNYYLCPFIKKVSPHTQIIVDMSDPLVINAGFQAMSAKQQKKLKEIEDTCFSYIDYLIVLNEEIKNYYLALPHPPKNCMVVEQGISDNWEMKNSIMDLSLKEEVKFMYAGRFYKSIREPYELYQVFTQNHKNISLTLFSDFNRYPEFSPPQQIKISCKQPVQQNQILQEYQKYDVMVFIDNQDNYQVPGKLFELLATSKPILFIYTNSKSPSLKYIHKEEGVFIAINNEVDITSAIEDILKTGKSFYQRDTRKYTWEHLFKRMDFLFKN